ncbi:MAG TPA: GNAT family N-acetyltransferase [Mycobacteriales bacterium]|nr:GNAT family N-acetyltransferase [Mycobacteriales bacterium]
MLIRPASGPDVPALLELVTSAYRGEASRAGWTHEADLVDGSRTDVEELSELVPDLLVADEDGVLVGCCALSPRDDRGYFGTFAVRPALQGGGVGSALLGAAEQRARDLGLSEVEMTVLTVRTELIAYYARRGYADTGETRPFPYGVERNGRPRRDDLVFAVLRKAL